MPVRNIVGESRSRYLEHLERSSGCAGWIEHGPHLWVLVARLLARWDGYFGPGKSWTVKIGRLAACNPYPSKVENSFAPKLRTAQVQDWGDWTTCAEVVAATLRGKLRGRNKRFYLGFESPN